MRAYSQDLRRKVLEAVERGMSKAQAAHLFGVSPSSAVKRYARMACRGSSLTPKKGSGRPPKIHEQAKKLLEEDAKERPAATPSQIGVCSWSTLQARPSATRPSGGS